MPYTPEAYAWSPVNYVGKSGSIPAFLLYEAGGLCYVRFRVASAWPSTRAGATGTQSDSSLNML
jgi:hypothetical protein